MYFKTFLMSILIISLEFFYIALSNNYNSNIQTTIQMNKYSYFNFTLFLIKYNDFVLSQQEIINPEYFKNYSSDFNKTISSLGELENNIFILLKSESDKNSVISNNIVSLYTTGKCTDEIKKIDINISNSCAKITKSSLKLEISLLIEKITYYLNYNVIIDSKNMVNFRKQVFDNYKSFTEDITIFFNEIVKPSVYKINRDLIISNNKTNLTLFIIFMIILLITMISGFFLIHRDIGIKIQYIKSFIFIIKNEDIMEIPNILDEINNEVEIETLKIGQAF